MSVVTDDPQTATGGDPVALMEEARQRQRQRVRRQKLLLGLAVVIVVLAFGVYRLAQEGSAVQGAPTASVAAGRARTVAYDKTMEEKIVPHVPVETRTVAGWYASDGGREVITLSGGRRFELGFTYVRDKVLGPEQVNYLYDPATRTIYRTGFILDPRGTMRTREQFFKQEILGNPPGAHLAGTRTYEGRRVYVVESASPGLRTTTYVDRRTYQVLWGVGVSHDLRTVQRGLAEGTLPATKANLALASLSATHPQARIVLEAPPRIKQLYREAAYF